MSWIDAILDSEVPWKTCGADLVAVCPCCRLVTLYRCVMPKGHGPKHTTRCSMCRSARMWFFDPNALDRLLGSLAPSPRPLIRLTGGPGAKPCADPKFPWYDEG